MADFPLPYWVPGSWTHGAAQSDATDGAREYAFGEWHPVELLCRWARFDFGWRFSCASLEDQVGITYNLYYRVKRWLPYSKVKIWSIRHYCRSKCLGLTQKRMEIVNTVWSGICLAWEDDDEFHFGQPNCSNIFPSKKKALRKWKNGIDFLSRLLTQSFGFMEFFLGPRNWCKRRSRGLDGVRYREMCWIFPLLVTGVCCIQSTWKVRKTSALFFSRYVNRTKHTVDLVFLRYLKYSCSTIELSWIWSTVRFHSIQ